MKHPAIPDIHLRKADQPHYRLKLSCGIMCATGLSFAAHVFDYSLAAVVSMVINAVVAFFWIWE